MTPDREQPPLHNLWICNSREWRSWRDCDPRCPYRQWCQRVLT